MISKEETVMKKIISRGFLGIPLGITISNILAQVISVIAGRSRRGFRSCVPDMGKRIMEPCKAECRILFYRGCGNAAHSLYYGLDGAFGHRLSDLYDYICSYLPDSLADTVFQVEGKGKKAQFGTEIMP